MNYSVIIPFYKAYPFFEEALASVLAQTLPPTEVLIVDDEATDTSRPYLDKFSSSLVQVISLSRNAGAANARNVGIAAAAQEWLAFQDADDIWEPNKMELQFAYLREHPEWAGCHTGVRVFIEEGKVIATYVEKPPVLQIDHLLLGSHVTPPSLLIRKKVVTALGGMDISFTTSEDYEFSIRLVKAGYKLGFVPHALVRVRRQQQGNLSSKWHRTLFNHIRLMRRHKDVFIHYKGPQVARCFLAKSIRESSGKLGGISGRLLYQIGKLLDPSCLKSPNSG